MGTVLGYITAFFSSPLLDITLLRPWPNKKQQAGQIVFNDITKTLLNLMRVDNKLNILKVPTQALLRVTKFWRTKIPYIILEKLILLHC